MGRTLEQYLADEKPEVVAEAKIRASELLMDIHLAELHEWLLQHLSVTLEKPEPAITISGLCRYVEAFGGKARLNIELADGSHYILEL